MPNTETLFTIWLAGVSIALVAAIAADTVRAYRAWKAGQ